MGQERDEEKPEDGGPICSHAKTKVRFGDKKSSNVQTQTLIDAPRRSTSASEGSFSREYPPSSSKWRDPLSDVEVARRHQTDLAVQQSGHEDSDTRTCPNPHQFAKCQQCDIRSSGSRPPSAQHEKKIYLHLNLKDRESPQLVVCPKRNHFHRHSASRDTVIDVDSISLPMPSRPPSRSRSRLSEPALSMSSCNTPRSGHRAPRDSSHELQSLRQAYGSGSKSLGERLSSPAASSNQRQFKAQLVQNVLTPRSLATPRVTGELATSHYSGRYSTPQNRVAEKVIARDGYVDETRLPLPKWPHGQQMSVGSSQSTPQVVEPDSSTVAKTVSTRRSTKMRDPMRVKGGSGTPTLPAEPDVESATEQTEGIVLSWESLTVTSK